MSTPRRFVPIALAFAFSIGCGSSRPPTVDHGAFRNTCSAGISCGVGEICVDYTKVDADAPVAECIAGSDPCAPVDCGGAACHADATHPPIVHCGDF